MKRLLFVLSLAVIQLSVSAQQLARYEYWFDHNSDHRVQTPYSDSIIAIKVNANGLLTGIHSFSFRALDSKGRWSSPFTSYFLHVPSGQATWTYEYWFDSDHAHRMTGQGTGDMIDMNIHAQDLAVGIHSFNFRAKDEAGRWSVPVTTYFMRAGNALDPAATYTYEYWLDEDVDQKKSGASADGLISLDIDASRLKAGIHFLAIRIKDDRGNWAAPLYHYFVKPHTRVDNLVAAYYYWFNGHVEDAQLVRLTTPASPLMLDVKLPTNNLYQEVTRENITMLNTADGQQQLAIKNVLFMQFMDERGQWSTTQVDTFAVAVGDQVVSLTPFIVNPEADEEWKGWTTQGNRTIDSSDHWSGKDNNYFRIGNNGEMHQTVSGLPAGTYMLTAHGRAGTGASLTLDVAGYNTDFAPTAEEDEDWTQRSVTFFTDGQPFDIVVKANGLDNGQWADIDGFELTVNGIVDRAGTIDLSDLQIAAINDVSTWNEVGSPVSLNLKGRYQNKKGRTATIYCSVDNGTAVQLAEDIEAGSTFVKTLECFFRENANPHTLSFYGCDSEGITSERVVLEIGNINRGCVVENLPQTAIYTGRAIEIDSLHVRDSHTGELLTVGKDYTLYYNDNIDDGVAVITLEGVYPRYLGRKEVRFSIKSEIAPAELSILRQLYAQTLGDSLWHRKWDAIQKDQVLSDELTGVSVRNHHVTAIQLRGNGLTGTTPTGLLALPYLQTLNLENNSLTGTIEVEGLSSSLKEVYLANNRLSRLSGALPSTVEKVSLRGQNIDDVFTFHLTAHGLAEQLAQLPNIGLYDHDTGSFNRQVDVSVMADSYQDPTLAMLSQRNGDWTLRTDEWGNRVYRKLSGDTIYCSDDADNRFRVSLKYDAGDANIDGMLNVQDLSALILYCLNDYNATFNYVAANLWQDETMNVQDAVCLVNVLLDGTLPQMPDQPAGARVMRYTSECTIQHSILNIEDGRLLLASPEPVSAFDVVLEHVRLQDVSSLIESQGFIVSMKEQSGNLHLVGYSPVGGLLPVGETALVSVNSEHAKVKAALLANHKAKAIEVICADAQGVKEVSSGSLNVTMKKDALVVTSSHTINNVTWTLLTVGGAVIASGHVGSLPSGVSTLPCRMPQEGIYILRLTADGHQTTVRKINIR